MVKVAFGKLARPAYAVADGETLSWKLSGLLRKRCRIGPDLWAARPRGLRYGRFQADLSGVLLARQDLSLLAGLFSVLSYRSFQEQGSGFAAIPFGV